MHVGLVENFLTPNLIQMAVGQNQRYSFWDGYHMVVFAGVPWF